MSRVSASLALRASFLSWFLERGAPLGPVGGGTVEGASVEGVAVSSEGARVEVEGTSVGAGAGVGGAAAAEALGGEWISDILWKNRRRRKVNRKVVC